ncbi:hypothetical protein OnM2_032085 [Erysiphe neolycopersici]|uniref:Uncharacterized protein n=1 Tax=Erysiphe neolycopersici TaxID=212602 RepID=A0A420HYW4_9PEZI|nr:hypothetical protein OnM2_032085 [Erysiphe neolycopersici]
MKKVCLLSSVCVRKRFDRAMPNHLELLGMETYVLNLKIMQRSILSKIVYICQKSVITLLVKLKSKVITTQSFIKIKL